MKTTISVEAEFEDDAASFSGVLLFSFILSENQDTTRLKSTEIHLRDRSHLTTKVEIQEILGSP